VKLFSTTLLAGLTLVLLLGLAGNHPTHAQIVDICLNQSSPCAPGVIPHLHGTVGTWSGQLSTVPTADTTSGLGPVIKIKALVRVWDLFACVPDAMYKTTDSDSEYVDLFMTNLEIGALLLNPYSYFTAKHQIIYNTAGNKLTAFNSLTGQHSTKEWWTGEAHAPVIFCREWYPEFGSDDD
jgi:hypothetical protein